MTMLSPSAFCGSTAAARQVPPPPTPWAHSKPHPETLFAQLICLQSSNGTPAAAQAARQRTVPTETALQTKDTQAIRQAQTGPALRSELQ